MKNLLIILLIVGFNSNLHATPLKTEMLFLSPKKLTSLMQLLDQYKEIKQFRNLAQTDMDKCVPMGDGCFHPQYGYMENNTSAATETKPALEDRKLELKNFNSTETSLVNCDKDNYFDIFCGKEKATASSADYEVWFDVSSSLKEVDYNKDPNECGRRMFMNKVMEACKQRVRFAIYNTSIKEIGDHSSACMAYGTNDQKKLMGWMKESRAKYLLVVTDIDEVSPEMRLFLESNGAKFTGDGVKAYTTDDLIDYAKDFTKMCK